MPNIHLPGRKTKGEKGEEVKTTVASADGTLRKLGEKDLLLQTGKRAVLRFRLLAKTKFENKAGEAIRDSLMHAGDQISVQVSPDDPETAVRVVLLRSASPAERASAEQPVEDAAVRAPVASDLSKPRTVTTREAAATVDTAPAAGSAEDGDAPKLQRRTEGSESTSDVAAPDDAPAAGSNDPRRYTDAQIIQDARTAAGTFSASLPNYLVEQVTARYFATGFPTHWQEIDEVTADLAYVDGKEDYRNFRINGSPVSNPERSGTWSTGEFGTTLEDVMSLGTNAAFKRRGEEKMMGRTAVVYDYSVAQGNSHWTMVSPDGRQYKPAYDGRGVDRQGIAAGVADRAAGHVVPARFHAQPGGMQAAIRLGEDRAEELPAAVVEREYRLHERQRGVHAERAGVQELPEVHDGEQYHVREVAITFGK